jgi:hypothetical protein
MYTIQSLREVLPQLYFEALEPEIDSDFCTYIDYIVRVSTNMVGIQIKPVTAKANFGNYSVTERMKANFEDFTAQYSGKVFTVFSLDGEIANKEILTDITTEIARLKKIP